MKLSDVHFPPFEIVPIPNPVAVRTDRYVAVALSYEQALDAFTHCVNEVLCVDVPRAAYCLSCDDAKHFFDEPEPSNDPER